MSYAEIGQAVLEQLRKHGPLTTRELELKAKHASALTVLLWLEGHKQIAKDRETGKWCPTPELAAQVADRNARALAEERAKHAARQGAAPVRTIVHQPTPPPAAPVRAEKAEEPVPVSIETDDQEEPQLAKKASRREAIKAAVGSDVFIGLADAQELLGGDQAAARQAILRAVKAGRLQRTGEFRSYRYRLEDLVALRDARAQNVVEKGAGRSPAGRKKSSKRPVLSADDPAPYKLTEKGLGATRGRGRRDAQPEGVAGAMRAILEALAQLSPEAQARVMEATRVLLGTGQ